MFYFLILFIILIIVSAVTYAYGAWKAAPYVPTWDADLHRIFKLADLKPGQKLYDLGCGDGRIVAAAAKIEAIAEGLEVSLLPYLWAKIKLASTPNAKIRFEDFWSKNLSDADVVYFFLTPKVMPDLKIKLEKELRPGSKVISFVFELHGWQPTIIDKAPKRPTIYFYQR